MRVRRATEADIHRVLDMGADFYATTSYAGIAEYDRASAAVLARMMVSDGVLLLAESEGRVVGMVGLLLAPFPFNHAKVVAQEVMWWVDESARSTGAGIALLRAIEPACREAGALAIQMMNLSTSPPAAAALYERMGYAHSESSFTKVL